MCYYKRLKENSLFYISSLKLKVVIEHLLDNEIWYNKIYKTICLTKWLFLFSIEVFTEKVLFHVFNS